MIYGALATGAGYTPREIDNLTWWDALDIFEYWKEHPPAHLSIMAYLHAIAHG